MAPTGSMCVQDRQRLSAALGLATTVTDSAGRYPQTAAARVHRQIVAGLSSTGARTNTAELPRYETERARQTEEA
jgi:hypothetical protein